MASIGSYYIQVMPDMSKFSSTVTSTLKSIGTTIAAGAAAVTAGVTAIGVAAFNSYSEYEQLVGGVQKLYGTAGQSLEEFASTAKATARDIESSGVDWDKYADEYWYQNSGIEGMFEEMEYNFEELGTSAEELAEYLHFEYDLDMSDAMAAIEAYQNALTDEGIQAKFEQQQQAQQLVMDNAMEAYKTAGMSANEYMETATQFSASLINSLGGDTQKAAELTDVAMRAISDNVDTFGSNIEDVSNAFKGFSKQNYTMLDNLKLGYGGCEDEMKRLIADANEYAESIGEASDLSMDSFADIVTAIELIQEKQNIAGTTANEASTTIQGSLRMAQKSWENLLTAFGTGDEAMISDAMNGIIDGIFGSVNEQTKKREGGLIKNAMPIVKNIAKAIKDALPSLVGEIGECAIDLVREVFGDEAADTITSIVSMLETATNTVVNFIDEVRNSEEFTAFINGIRSAVDWVIQNSGTIVPIITGIVAALGTFSIIATVSGWVSGLTTVVSSLFAVLAANPIVAIVTLIAGLVTALVTWINTTEEGQKFWSDFCNFMQSAWQGVCDFFAGVPEFWSGIWDSVTGKCEEIGESISAGWDTLKTNASEAWNNIKTTVGNAWDGIKDGVGSAVDTVKNGVAEGWNQLKTNTGNAFNAVKDSISDKLTAAKEGAISVADAIGEKLGFPGLGQKVKSIFNDIGKFMEDPLGNAVKAIGDGINNIKNWFSSLISSIKMPHLSVTGSLNPLDWFSQGLPNISIAWYAKGGFFNGATLYGVGLGERGTELAWPEYEPYFSKYAKGIADHLEPGGNTTVVNFYINGERVTEQGLLDLLDKVLDEAGRYANMNLGSKNDYGGAYAY